MPGRLPGHHLQPGQLNRAHRQRSVQEGGQAQPGQDFRRHHPRHCQSQQVHLRAEGAGPTRRQLPGRRRTRRYATRLHTADTSIHIRILI